MRKIKLVALFLALTLVSCSPPSAGVLWTCASGEQVMADGKGNEYILYKDHVTVPVSDAVRIDNYPSLCVVS